MPVNLKGKRELVARILGIGANRVRFEPDKLDDIADSITREDLRSLVRRGTIWTTRVKGTSRGRARTKQAIRKKSGLGPGSKKGKKTARMGKKSAYVRKVRSMRHHLKVLKDRNEINRQTYWLIYKKINGSQVRSVSHLREIVKQAKAR
jgi:large subunit ribosomal protein L19e